MAHMFNILQIQRSPVRHLDQSDPLTGMVSCITAFKAEQFCFYLRICHGCAVDRYKCFFGAGRRIVNCLRKHSLPRPAFPVDQNRGVVQRDPPGKISCADDLRAFADDVLKPAFRPVAAHGLLPAQRALLALFLLETLQRHKCAETLFFQLQGNQIDAEIRAPDIQQSRLIESLFFSECGEQFRHSFRHGFAQRFTPADIQHLSRRPVDQRHFVFLVYTDNSFLQGVEDDFKAVFRAQIL